MSRIDRVFEELGQLYELNREIRRSVWLDTGKPVHAGRECPTPHDLVACPASTNKAVNTDPSHSTPPSGNARMEVDSGAPHDHRPA